MSLPITPELLARYDRPAPRYTSYPTAVEFREDFGAAEYAARLTRSADQPLSLYVHLPFCESRCWFCACHVVVTRRKEVASAYLERVITEAGLVAGFLGESRTIEQYHWGGGTPTYYSADDLTTLHRAIFRHFRLADDAEMAVEVDPRVTTSGHLQVLRELGFNRLSLGVQDFSPIVQALIGRNQTWEETRTLYEVARRLGYTSINFDLVYGLPGQDVPGFKQTLDRVLDLLPDRLAVYSFAHVPWVRPHQKRIDAELLPDRDLKLSLLALTIATLTGAGYRQIGMDHFALPDDELSLAQESGTLSRNFQGYTARRAPDTVALGTSGISDVSGTYAQNHRRLALYYRAVDAGRLPIERGLALSDDDHIRRFVITSLMCNFRVLASDIAGRFGVSFHDYFDAELEAMLAPGGLVDEGMALIDQQGIAATDLGRLFIRNVAMTFDRYLRHSEESGRPVFSRTV